MEDNKTKKCGCHRSAKEAAKHTHAMDNYPGAAIDSADCEHVTEAEVKERTKTLNNNPRNSAMHT